MTPRLPPGSSDPIAFTCTCSARASGLVLLFYRYYTHSPILHPSPSQTPSSLAAFHTSLCHKYDLGGKLRIAAEGFNITIAGSRSSINAYIAECTPHWSFSGLGLDSDEQKCRDFFKPTDGGCKCVFGGEASVRVTAEITPMGVQDYQPRDWDVVTALSPPDFHERCLRGGDAEKMVLLDVRNHYESRIGYFVDPRTGQPAVRPAIRRFSQFPGYVKQYFGEETEARPPREIMGYCTGGIRCEKSMRFLAENMDSREGDRVFTLQGGIAAYLLWMDAEIRLGRKTSEDSLFKGKNYVFDARGSMGLEEGSSTEPVAACHACGTREDRLSKCRSTSCHLILVICRDCEEAGEARCCADCSRLDRDDADAVEGARKLEGPRRICSCERAREMLLWGGERVKVPRAQGWRKARKVGGIDVRIKTID